MADSHTVHTVATEAIKAAPPVAVSASVVAGMTPADWVTALTLIYVLMQIILLAPRLTEQVRTWWRKLRGSAHD